MKKRWTIPALALLLAACTANPAPIPSSAPLPSPAPTLRPASTPSSASTPQPAGTAQSAGNAPTSPASRRPDLDAAPQEMARDLDVPWGLAFLPGGDALIAERPTGRILRLAPGRGSPRRVATVDGVRPDGEAGLLGLALSPGFSRDNLVYAYFTADSDNRIVRFRLDGTGPQQVIFKGIAKADHHDGGRIAFGPDGMLYVGTGDAGETGHAQDRSSVNGKILRLTPDGNPAPGNPFPGSPVWTYGHRNVQGLAWDAQGNLFATEFGQDRLDEVNLIRPGRDYGWPIVEGRGGNARYTDPLVQWPVSQASPSGIAISGGTAYVAALRGERLWVLPLSGTTIGKPVAKFVGGYGRLRTVQIAPDGSLWVTTSNRDGRGDVRPGDDRVLRFPAR